MTRSPGVQEGVVFCGDEDARRADAGDPDKAVGVVVQLTHGPVAIDLAGQYFVQLLQQHRAASALSCRASQAQGRHAGKHVLASLGPCFWRLALHWIGAFSGR